MVGGGVFRTRKEHQLVTEGLVVVVESEMSDSNHSATTECGCQASIIRVGSVETWEHDKKFTVRVFLPLVCHAPIGNLASTF